MARTWKIYAIFHPHTHDMLYVGQTHRAIHDRKEEHFLGDLDTLISKKINQIKDTTGDFPHFGILEDGIPDERTAHYRELYYIYKHLSEGAALLNREARDWFYEAYDEVFTPQGQGRGGKPRRTAAKKKAPPSLSASRARAAQAEFDGDDAAGEAREQDDTAHENLLALKSETYRKIQAEMPELDVEKLERDWRAWLVDKNPPNYPDAHFIAFCRRAIPK